jgi:hypothetical protein
MYTLVLIYCDCIKDIIKLLGIAATVKHFTNVSLQILQNHVCQFKKHFVHQIHQEYIFTIRE